MYLVHIHAKKHEMCEDLELGFWVCCDSSVRRVGTKPSRQSAPAS